MEEKTDSTQVEEGGVQTTAQSAPEAASATPVTQSAPGKGGKIALAAIIILIVGALAYALTQQPSGSTAEMGDISFDSGAPAPSFDDVPEVVATVNGESITKDDYITAYQQSYQVAVQQGADMSDPSVLASLQTQTLDVLVNTALIVQAAEAAEVMIDDAMVATERDLLVTQFGGEEGFLAALETSGVSEEVLAESIREQLLVQAYIDATLDASATAPVTTEAVQARYDEVAATVTDLPPLEEVSEQIVLQLEAEQQDVATQALLNELRTEAEVMTFVDGE